MQYGDTWLRRRAWLTPVTIGFQPPFGEEKQSDFSQQVGHGYRIPGCQFSYLEGRVGVVPRASGFLRDGFSVGVVLLPRVPAR